MTDTAPVLERIPDCTAMLPSGEDEAMLFMMRKAETIGRPVGSPAWLADMEQRTGLKLQPGKRGRKRKVEIGE